MKDRILSVKSIFKKYLCYVQIKVCFWKETVFWYVQRKYVHKECWFEYTEAKTDDRNCLYLSIKRSICIMYRWNLYVQGNIMYIKECYGTYTVKEAHWLKEISQGILSLEPMDSVYKQTNENKWKKFVYVWILTKMFWICTK